MYPQPFPQTREVAGAQGGAVVLARGTVSAAPSIDVTWHGVYDQVIALYDDLTVSVGLVRPLFRLSGDHGASWDAGASDYYYGSRRFSFIVSYATSATADGLYATDSGIGNDAGQRGVFRVVIDEPWDETRYPHLRGTGGFDHTTNTMFATFGGRRNTAMATNGIRLLMASGTLSGKYVVWGIRRLGR